MAYFDDKLDEEEYKVLKGFFPEAKDITIKQIQKRVGYSYERANYYLKSLTKKKAITEKRVGKTLVYALNVNNWHCKMAFYLYSNERARKFASKHIVIHNALKKLPEDVIDMLLIFGSYAKGTATKNSDIDILAVGHKKEEIENPIASLKRSHNLNFSPVILSKKEFSKIREENKEFWDDIVQFGIVFKGQDLLYYYIYSR